MVLAVSHCLRAEHFETAKTICFSLRQRGEANGLSGLEVLSPEAMREIEPHVMGVKALKVPSTGITDYGKVAAKYAELAVARGIELKTSARVVGFRISADEIVIQTRA